MNSSKIRVAQFQRRPFSGSFSIERVFSDIRRVMPEDIDTELVVSRHFSVGLMPRLRAAWEARCKAADINHVTGDVHFLTYFLPRSRTVLTIHDCDLFERARGVRRWLLWFFWFWLPAKRCARIVAISAETKRCLLDSLRCREEKVVVISDPLSSDFTPVPYQFNEKRPRLLQVGTKTNKNLERLIPALAGLDLTLVIIGPLSLSQRQFLEFSGIDFENLERLSDNDLRTQYAAADIVTFVSTSEGFGLPIVEAQAIGRPVVTSDIAPMNDVAGLGARLVDPFDIASIREGILDVLSDAKLREELLLHGFENITRFSPSNVARAYADLYREVAIAAEDPDKTR